MLALILLAAAQALPPSSAAMEAQARRVLAGRGLSPAGIEASIAVEHRHEAQMRAIVERGKASEIAIRAALAKRPVDVDGFARAMNAHAEAAAGLQREAAQVTIDQMRAVSPADRIVLAQARTQPPPAPPKR